MLLLFVTEKSNLLQ